MEAVLLGAYKAVKKAANKAGACCSPIIPHSSSGREYISTHLLKLDDLATLKV
jgi:hypothetical protein